MVEIVINNNESGQRLDKFLKKYLDKAPQSFIYKMLRKKNIVLNGKKSDGTDIINSGDIVKLFLSEDTINNFRQNKTYVVNKSLYKSQLDILYEDEDFLFINKKIGQLSQKATDKDISVNELILDYLINNDKLSLNQLDTFRPSVCNRLDRNTSGIITAGKSLYGSRYLSEGFANRSFDKYYICVVNGVITTSSIIDGYIYKDEKNNKVTISTDYKEGYDRIVTEYIPYKNNGTITLLKIKLHTGKSHQIRAHLASIGHSLIGDNKYGKTSLNKLYESKYGIKSQFLHSFELYIPQKSLRIYADMPKQFINMLKGEYLWVPGSLEDLEALH